MNRKPYNFWDQLDYMALTYDSDEEKKMNDKTQLEILEQCVPLFNDYILIRRMYDNSFPKSETLSNKGVAAFKLFAEKYDQLRIEFKTEFCIDNMPFNLTKNVITKMIPTSEESHLIYWLMYQAGWPDEVIAYKFKLVLAKEKEKIKHLRFMENALQYNSQIMNSKEMLEIREQHSQQYASLLEDNFGPCLKRKREDDSDFPSVYEISEEELAEQMSKKMKQDMTQQYSGLDAVLSTLEPGEVMEIGPN